MHEPAGTVRVRVPFGQPEGCCPACIEGKTRIVMRDGSPRVVLCECMELRLIEIAGGNDVVCAAAINDLQAWFMWRARALFRPVADVLKIAHEGDEYAKAVS